MHWVHIQISYITNISSEMNLKIGEYREISKKDKIFSKIRKFSKNCSMKTELFFSKELIIQNASAKYKLWIKYSGILKKFLNALVTQNIKKVFIFFLRIIHRYFRVAPWSLKIWKGYIQSVFEYLRTDFTLHVQVSFCVRKTEKEQSHFKTLHYLTSG